MNKSELTDIFSKLGADDPEEWAESQIEEGIPQLARYIFLKGCWDNIIKDGDTSWINNQIDNTPVDSREPFSGIAHALRRLLDSGADPKDLIDLVRGAQAELLFSFCNQLDDPDSVEDNQYVNWGLVQLDDDDQPTNFISGLHESVLETDPTGREMTPRNS